MQKALLFAVISVLLIPFVLADSYSPTTKTICDGVSCETKYYAGLQYVFEDEIWKPYQEAKSLKNSGISCSISEDGIHFAECLDFNATHIKLDLSVEDLNELNKDVRFRVHKGNNSDNRLDFNLKFFTEGKKYTYEIPMSLGEIAEIGANSTLVTYNLSGASNLIQVYNFSFCNFYSTGASYWYWTPSCKNHGGLANMVSMAAYDSAYGKAYGDTNNDTAGFMFVLNVSSLLPTYNIKNISFNSSWYPSLDFEPAFHLWNATGSFWRGMSKSLYISGFSTGYINFTTKYKTLNASDFVNSSGFISVLVIGNGSMAAPGSYGVDSFDFLIEYTQDSVAPSVNSLYINKTALYSNFNHSVSIQLNCSDTESQITSAKITITNSTNSMSNLSVTLASQNIVANFTFQPNQTGRYYISSAYCIDSYGNTNITNYDAANFDFNVSVYSNISLSSPYLNASALYINLNQTVLIQINCTSENAVTNVTIVFCNATSCFNISSSFTGLTKVMANFTYWPNSTNSLYLSESFCFDGYTFNRSNYSSTAYPLVCSLYSPPGSGPSGGGGSGVILESYEPYQDIDYIYVEYDLEQALIEFKANPTVPNLYQLIKIWLYYISMKYGLITKG